MLTTLGALLPIAVGLTAGVLLRRVGLVGPQDGLAVFRLVMAFFMPLLLFHTIATAELDVSLLAFPTIATAAMVLGFGAATALGRLRGWPTEHTAVLTVAAMMVNLGFQYPFAEAVGGPDAMARLAACDVVTSILSFTWVYAIAVRANPAHSGRFVDVLRRLALSPMLWAVLAATALNLGDVSVAPSLMRLIELFGAPTTVILPVAIGMTLTLPRNWRPALVGVGLRLGSGLSVAALAVVVLGLTGVDRLAALLIGVAPVGFVLVPFAATEGLDVDLASSTLSLALLVGIVSSLAVCLLFT